MVFTLDSFCASKEELIEAWNQRAQLENGECRMTETPKCIHNGAPCCRCMPNGPCAAPWPTKKTQVEALSAALHRAEPEMRPLTLEEVRAHCAKGPDAEPLWAEFKEECAISRWILAVIPPDVFDRPVLSEWIATDRSEKYGKEWRCWPRKPTPEQMAAEKWEE